LPDAWLVARARDGVAGIEERLFERLAPVINRVVWTLLGQDSEHDDVTHDVFVRVLRGVGKLREPGRLEDWAARVAINAVRNELRRRRLRRWVSWSPLEDAEPPGYAPDLDGREVLARAYRALERLPANERVLLSLRLFEARTLEELAALVGCSPTTAKRRLRRARERFAAIAEQDPLLKPWLGRAEGDEDG
jgi:RNA polymerase sigma-70 factor (ECF subfamily)